MNAHIRSIRQRGTTLVIALIVLVALTLAGVAMMRSVDTAGAVAGNIAFKQSTIIGSDQGLQTAYGWLLGSLAGATLNSDSNTPGTGNGYFASVPAVDPSDWNSWNRWPNAVFLNGGVADASGNIVSYVIERMCQAAGPPGTQCGSTPSTGAVAGYGVDLSQANFFTQQPAVHYRITVRSTGPRNSVSIVQTMLRGQ